jgi:membrane associated rhomboid family serine protease
MFLLNVLINLDWNNKSIDINGHLGGLVMGTLLTGIYYYTFLGKR